MLTTWKTSPRRYSGHGDVFDTVEATTSSDTVVLSLVNRRTVGSQEERRHWWSMTMINSGHYLLQYGQSAQHFGSPRVLLTALFAGLWAFSYQHIMNRHLMGSQTTRITSTVVHQLGNVTNTGPRRTFP